MSGSSLPPSSTISGIDRVLLLREEMRLHWEKGQRTPVEEWLSKCPDLSEDEMLDLVYQEYILRDELGETAPLEEYAHRFPKLHASLKRQVALYEMIKSESLAEHDSDAPTVMATPERGGGDDWKPGRKIQQYHLLAELGRGGMGVVFKAHDEKLHRPVALKMLLNKEHAPADLIQRFRVEAETLAQLQHPNIVQIFDVIEHEGTPLFAMEYVAGDTLQHLVRVSVLEPRAAALQVAQLARAMHSAHQRGIIHRDLKPSNVLVNADKVPKITDFGLARLGNSELTAPGAIMGTPSYMAPEQAQGEHARVGPVTDVYSLGAILFELLTGRAPFRGATIPATLHQVVHADPPSLRRLQPGVPRDLETITLKCLQKDVGKRYVSAEALAEDLERWLRGEPIRARPVGRLETLWKWARREPKVAVLAASLMLLAVVGFAVVTYQWQSERKLRLSRDEQLYFNRIALASHELNAGGKAAWALDALEKCPPELRDWEWQHLRWRCGHGDAPMLTAPGDVSAVASGVQKDVVAVGCHNGKLLVMDGDATRGPWQAHLGSVNGLAFADNDILSGGEDGQVCAWDAATGEKRFTYDEHQGPISCVAVHPKKAWVASTTFRGPDSGEIFIWDRASRERVFTLKNHKLRVTALAFDPAGKLLASASHDNTITLWDMDTGNVVRVFRHNHPVSVVAFNHSGKTIASAAGRLASDRPEEDEIFLWDVATGAIRHRLQGHARRAVTLAFAPHDTRLATAGWDHQVKLWDVSTGQEVLTLQGHTGGIMGLAFAPRGALYTGGLDGAVRTWQIEKE